MVSFEFLVSFSIWHVIVCGDLNKATTLVTIMTGYDTVHLKYTSLYFWLEESSRVYLQNFLWSETSQTFWRIAAEIWKSDK